MSLSRNNHYIPQMYLSRWANNGKILVYQLLVSHEKVPVWNSQSISHTASLPNLYLSVCKNEESDSLEHDFDSQFESPAQRPLARICDEEKMTSKDWGIIGDYIVAQYVRTPAFYLWIKEWGTDSIPKQIDEIGKSMSKMREVPQVKHKVDEESSLIPIGVRFTDEKPDEIHTYVEISAVSGKGLWLFAIKHTLKEHSALREYFSNLKWSIITAPEGDCWPSCDNPVVICNVNENVIRRASVSEGVAGRSKAILFPVSPKKVLIATSVRKYTWRLRADKEMSAMIRGAIVNNALMYIYSSREDDMVTNIRPRTVDEAEYKRVKKDFENWFNNYKEIEGPLLQGYDSRITGEIK